MAVVRFRAQIATDPQSGLPRPELAGASGQIVLEGTTTPAPIWEDAAQDTAIVDSLLTVSAQIFVPQFYVEDLYEVDWWDGLNRVPLDSNAGTRDAALVAASASELSAAAAALASAAAAAAAADAAAAAVGGTVLWENVQDKPPLAAATHTHGVVDLRRNGSTPLATPVASLLAATDEQQARAAIGAGTGSGTSNLKLGPASTDAASATHTHAASGIEFTPVGALTATTVQDAIAQAATLGGGGGGTSDTMKIRYASGAWPTLPGSAPSGILYRVFYGPVPYMGATWANVIDEYKPMDL